MYGQRTVGFRCSVVEIVLGEGKEPSNALEDSPHGGYRLACVSKTGITNSWSATPTPEYQW